MELLAEDLEIEVGCRARGFKDDRLAILGLFLLGWRRHLDCCDLKVENFCSLGDSVDCQPETEGRMWGNVVVVEERKERGRSGLHQPVLKAGGSLFRH